jgi:hypothetical protein
MKRAVFHDIHSAAEQVLEVLDERYMVEERAIIFQPDQNIQIAILIISASGNGPENADVAGAVTGSDPKNFGFKILNVAQRNHWSPVS